MSKGFFSNCFLNGIDGKNRLSIPSDYRAAVTARSGTRDLVMAPSRIAPCLLGYDETFFAQLKAEHDARHANQVSRERDRDATGIFGVAAPLTIDDAGRIVLPSMLKKMRGIGTLVWFIGAGDFFQAWDPWAYLGYEDADPGVLEALEFMMDERGLPRERPAA